MKKILIFIILLIPFNVFAYNSGPLSVEEFYINSQTTDPFHITISSNSNTTAYFHFYDIYNTSNVNDLLGPYYFVSIVSNKKIDIKRTNNVGVSCNNSCFDNSVYLLMTDNTPGAYGYLFYFNARKYQDIIGSIYTEFKIDDNFRFYNKESGTADVYIYGAYASSTNEIPGLIDNANATTQILEQEQQSTNNIIQNNDDNTQSIIDNDNSNTQQIIDSNKVCRNITIDKNKIVLDNSYFSNSSGTISHTSNNDGITDYIEINSSSDTLTGIASYPYSYSCFYNENKTLISCFSNNFSANSNITIPTNAKFVRFSIYKVNNTPRFNLYSCVNGNQANNEAINDLNDNITNSGIDNPNSDFSEMEDMLAENGVITNLLSLPITLYSKILNSVNGTCSSYNLGTLFGTSITFSCISLQTLLGDTIWGVVDILFSGFTIYAIAKKMIKVFNSMSSLKEGDVIDD